MQRVVISGSGLYTPAESISNEELVASLNAYVADFNETHAAEIAAGDVTALAPSSAEFIVKASGIESRYVMNKSGVLDPKRMKPFLAERPDEALGIQAEMGLAACQAALARAQRRPEDVDAIIVACSNMQRAYPAVAIEIQQALGARGYAYDMNVACSSATFGLQAAADAIRSGSARVVLVVCPEITSGHLDFTDRDCHFIFGDVATALVVESAETCRVPGAFEVIGSRLQTQFSNAIRNNFGFLNRCDERGVGARDKLFRQEGRKVFKEVCPMVADQLLAHSADLGLTVPDIQRFWLHQANLGMNQLIAKRVLGREPTPQEAPVILNEYANTSSAGSVIAFHLHHEDLAAGAVGVLCSFGAGYSIGSVFVKRLP